MDGCRRDAAADIVRLILKSKRFRAKVEKQKIFPLIKKNSSFELTIFLSEAKTSKGGLRVQTSQQDPFLLKGGGGARNCDGGPIPMHSTTI